jgi:hypothetical protein
MEERSTEDIIQQKAQEWTNAPQEQQQVAQPEPEQSTNQAAPKSNEPNFRALKAEKERLEYERNEAMRRLEEYERNARQQKPEEDYGIGPDEIAEGRHLRKLYEQNKILQQEIESIKHRTLEDTAEARISAKYPDFYSVVNSDSMAALRQADPEMADTLNDGRDLYKKAVSVYKAIKNLGVQTNGTEADKKRAQENMSKPRPLSSVSPQQGDTPLSQANAFAQGLTPELKKQLWKEMEEARSRM